MGSIQEVKTTAGEIRYKAEAVGPGRRKSKRCKSRREAQAWIVDTERGLALLAGSDAYGVTFADACERFAAEMDPKERRGHREERVRLAKFARLPIGQVPLEDIDLAVGHEHMEYLRAAGLKNDSITREFTLMKVVLKRCTVWYGLPYPWVGLRMYTKDASRTREITQGEINAIVEASRYTLGERPVAAQQKVGAMFLLAIETGMRLGEMCRMRRDQYDRERKAIDLHDDQTKTATARTIPLSETAMTILENLLPTKDDTLFGVKSSVASSTFRTLKFKCGWTDKKTWIRFHDARHLACMRLSKIPTMTPLKLARIMGHADVKQTMVYWHRDMAEVGEEIRSHQLVLNAGSELVDQLGAMNMTIEQMEAKIKQVREAEQALSESH